MLVLMRRVGQSIYIGEDIIVTLVEIEPARAWIGVETLLPIRTDRDPVYVRPKLGDRRPDMLVIARHAMERIYIGEDEEFVVTLAAIERSRVRIAVEADPNILIDREEIRERRLQEKREANSEPSRASSPVRIVPVRVRRRRFVAEAAAQGVSFLRPLEGQSE